MKHFIEALQWLGWVLSAIAFFLQVHSWRRERRVGPATEQLFEEALRDRQGRYSEEQIIELTRIVGSLERAARTELPRQARRVFLQSQLEGLTDSITSGVRQHRDIAAELDRLGEESKALPPAIVDIVDASIAPPAVERRRQVRRLYLLALLILAALIFPDPFGYVSESIVDVGNSVLGADYLVFGFRNIMSYAIAMVVGIFVTFAIPAHRLRLFVRRRRITALAIALSFVLLGIACIIYIGVTLRTDLSGDYTNFISAGSVGLLCIAIRVLDLLRQRSIS